MNFVVPGVNRITRGVNLPRGYPADGSPAPHGYQRIVQQWPDELTIVRHGESAGNIARDTALAGGLASIDIAKRDADVPLSQLGERQSRALGAWMKENHREPHAILASPFLRARQTAMLMSEAAGWQHVQSIVDERLREKEFGMLDRLTRKGILERFPDQAELFTRVGKFYYRPPGGESWTDVILRLRSIVDTLTRDYARRRVTVIAHQVIVLCFRYLFECLDEERILAIDREGDVANCSVTYYRFDASHGEHGGMQLEYYNKVTPLIEAGEPVTEEPDVPIAPK